MSHVLYLDDSEDACWVWTGAVKETGYGRFFVGRREIAAHRFAWEHANGPIPGGHRLEQECAHPQCVRHWELGGKQTKLTPRETDAIRASIHSTRALATKYGISRFRVMQIKHSRRVGCVSTVLDHHGYPNGGREYA